MVDAFRLRFTNIPFLFVADSFGLRLARELLARGARGLLLYSDGPDEIIRGLDYALKGGITISPMVLSDILESFQQCAQPKNNLFSLDLIPMDRRVLNLVCKGYHNEAIASKLNLSLSNVKKRVSRLLAYFNVSSRTQLAIKASKCQ